MYIHKEQQEIMLKTTSLVECTYRNQTKSYATCFFCKTNNDKIILVTNKHVFENCVSANFPLTVVHSDTNRTELVTLTLNLGNDIFYHSDYDICMLDITSIYYGLASNETIPQISLIETSAILTDYSNLNVLQEIVMLGYPGGIINISQNHPIIRIGVTATSIQERYNNMEIFLTDIPTFGGSSGSPIFITNNQGLLFLVGINSQTFNQVTPVYKKNIFKQNKIVGYVNIPNDIGIAVNSCVIMDMIKKY